MDQFEQRLQRQKLRKIPADWRAAILQSAQAAAVSADPRQPFAVRACLAVWREIFQPCRYAWLGMGALWLIFWLINSPTRTVEGPTSIAASTRRSSQEIRFVEEQRQVMAELTGSMGLSPAEPPQQTQPKPRSERRIEVRNC